MTKTKVLYNDACPICSREINHYDKIATKDGLPLQFDGLHQSAADWGITPDAAARRIHVHHNGAVISGMPAFIAIWSQIPKYHWLAKLFSLPIIRPIAAFIYDHIAAPLIYALHKRRQKKM